MTHAVMLRPAHQQQVLSVLEESVAVLLVSSNPVEQFVGMQVENVIQKSIAVASQQIVQQMYTFRMDQIVITIKPTVSLESARHMTHNVKNSLAQVSMPNHASIQRNPSIIGRGLRFNVHLAYPSTCQLLKKYMLILWSLLQSQLLKVFLNYF